MTGSTAIFDSPILLGKKFGRTVAAHDVKLHSKRSGIIMIDLYLNINPRKQATQMVDN